MAPADPFYSGRQNLRKLKPTGMTESPFFCFMGSSAVDLFDALKTARATRVGYGSGCRAACVAGATPEHGLIVGLCLSGHGSSDRVLGSRVSTQLKIVIFERLESAAEESSAAWNNAGTGHAALCELNYTPERRDGSIDISKPWRLTGTSISRGNSGLTW